MLLFLWFKLLTAQLNGLNCFFYRAGQNFYVKQSNGIIFENDYPKIDQIGYELFQKSFVMQNFSSGEIKSILFMNSIKFNVELIYCFCQLLDNFSTQIIVCIDGIEIDLKTNQYQKLKNAKITNIQIQTENGNCDQILPDYRNHIKAYCQNSTSVILNYINLQDQSTFQIISNRFIDEQNCQRKFFIFQLEEYLSYYNCSEWRIYQINKIKRNFQLILNGEIVNDSFHHQIKILNEIQNCQHDLYLIESNKYFLLKKHSGVFQLFDQKILTNEILKIFFANLCNIELIVTQNYGNQLIIFKKDKNEISIQQNTILAEIFYYQKFLLIKRKNELKLIFSEFLQQNYTLIEEPLICMNPNGLSSTQPIIDSFCYQIDTQFNKVIFYRLHQFKKFIKPSKQYVLQITNFQIFSTFATIKSDCYKILQDPFYTHQVVQDFSYDKLQISNFCNSIQQFVISKILLDSSLNFKLDIFPQQKQIIIDINDDFLFEQLCKTFEFNNIEKIVWVSFGKPTLFSYTINDIFYFYDCSKNNIYYQMNVQDQMILTFNDAFIIWKFNQNFFIQLQFFNKIAVQNILSYEYQVKDIILQENYLIIYFLDDWLIYDIYLSRQIYLDEQLKQYGSPKFYYGKGVNFQMVQFNNCLAIKSKNSLQFRIIQFINKQITKIKDSSKFIQIQVIHNKENLIQTFIFDGFDLTLTQEFLITEAQILRPLIVSQSIYHTILATTKNNVNSLILFYGNYQLNMIEIKAVKKLSFYISNEYLFYFDNQSNLRYKDLINYQIFLQTTSTQINAFDIYDVKLRFTFNYDNKIEQLSKPYKMILKNECNAIIPKNNEISIQQSKINQQLKINQFFYGSIDQISTNHTIISIKNPFEIDPQALIPYCLQKIDNFCYFFNYTNPKILDIDCLINQKDDGQITFEICKTRKCFKSFYIRSLQILVCFSHHFQQLLEIKILKFIVKEQQVMIDQLQSIKYYDEFESLDKLQILHTEFLFTIINKSFEKIKNYFFHLFIPHLNFEELVHFDICQITQIQNKRNHYLILISNKISSYQFMIISLEQEKIHILYQFNFNHIQFVEQLFKKNQFAVDNIIVINYLSSDLLVENEITAQFLVILDVFTLEVKLNFDLLTQLSNFKAQKIIRNPNQNKYKFIHYYDQKILIITSYKSLYYLYDLTQNLPIYSHFYMMNSSLNLIYEFNICNQIQSYSLTLNEKINQKIQIQINTKQLMYYSLHIV